MILVLKRNFLILTLLVVKIYSIRVPIDWNTIGLGENRKSLPELRHPIRSVTPEHYFGYYSNKPQFAIDVAQFHGVDAPHKHYRATRIQPKLPFVRPPLGRHRLLNQPSDVFPVFEQHVKSNDGLAKYLIPTVSNYEVFHPYKAETPGLNAIYKDENLNKVRYQLKNEDQRLTQYEQEAADVELDNNEFSKTPADEEDEKFQSAELQSYQPESKPVYYVPPTKKVPHLLLNSKLKPAINQDIAKIKPSHYYPLQSHFRKFRQEQAVKFGEGQNEYPGTNYKYGDFAEPPEGYDIFEEEKENFDKMRTGLYPFDNNQDDSQEINHQKIKGENDNEEGYYQEKEDDFVPTKTYAQVRKTELTKHLPKAAAIEEANSDDEVKNAPRLREAVKSTKAQTVYTEEGYEDSAYDHAGQQKHASNHEGHGGYLKEDEKSNGGYKIPSVDDEESNAGGSTKGNSVSDGKNWFESDKNNREHDEADINYEQGSQEEEYDDYVDTEPNDQNTSEESSVEKKVRKKRQLFRVPSVDLNNTYLEADEIDTIKKEKLTVKPKKKNHRYPYYDQRIINQNSPLRYAENYAFIPKKTKGGTEFYDSRSNIECLDVDYEVDPVPERIKNHDSRNDENNDNESIENDEKSEENESSDENVEEMNEKRKRKRRNLEENENPRLNGLGDKIDCFKTKYFGENPLDNPLFQEEIIEVPKLEEGHIKYFEELIDSQRGRIKSNLHNDSQLNYTETIDNVEPGKNSIVIIIESNENPNDNDTVSILDKKESSLKSGIDVYSDILKNIRESLVQSNITTESSIIPLLLSTYDNKTAFKEYKSFSNKEKVEKMLKRNKRSISKINDKESRKPYQRRNISNKEELIYKYPNMYQKNQNIKPEREITFSNANVPKFTFESRRGEPMYANSHIPDKQKIIRLSQPEEKSYDSNAAQYQIIKRDTSQIQEIKFRKRPRIKLDQKQNVTTVPTVETKNSSRRGESKYQNNDFSKRRSEPNNSSNRKIKIKSIEETNIAPKNRTINHPKVKEKSNHKEVTTVVTDTKVYGNDKSGENKEDNVDILYDTKDKIREYIPKSGEIHPEIEIEEKMGLNKKPESEFVIEESTEEIESYEGEDLEEETRLGDHESEQPKERLPIESNIEFIRENKNLSKYLKKDKDKNNQYYMHQFHNDDNLAKDVNKMKEQEEFQIPSDVEIISDIKKIKYGPKHGGNYKAAPEAEIKYINVEKKTNKPIASNEKSNILEGSKEKKKLLMHGGNLKAASFTTIPDVKVDQINKKPTAAEKPTEIIANIELLESAEDAEDAILPQMHGGNLRAEQTTPSIRQRLRLKDSQAEPAKHYQDINTIRKSQMKLLHDLKTNKDSIEAKDLIDVNKNSKMHGGNLRRPLNGFRAADVLDSLAKAVPVLTTAPPYILDPSKRMYYYVD